MLNYSIHYHPFGMTMPGRTYTTQNYRYGFQAQEEDPEFWGGAVTYKYRVEDPRLGRFFSVDPLAAKYAYNSPYAFSENRLIDKIELEGLEAVSTEQLDELSLNVTTASEIIFTVFVDQPGSGGDRDTWEYTDWGFDVGHSFISVRLIQADDSEVEFVFGFYPSDAPDAPGINPALGMIQTLGSVEEDGGHYYEVKAEFKIDKTDAQNLIDYVTGIIEKEQLYNLDTYNCTDFALQCAKAAGESLPDTQGTWVGGGGSSPGNLGEDLREINSNYDESGNAPGESEKGDSSSSSK